MNTYVRIAAMLVAVAVLCACPVHATDRIAVESQSVGMTETVTVGVYLENDATVNTIVANYVIRSLSNSAYPTAILAEYNTAGGRLDADGPGGALVDIVILNSYETEDGSCKSGEPGGFSTIAETNNDAGTPFDVDVPNPGDPDAIKASRSRIFGQQLEPGSDFPIGTGEPHLLLHFTAPSDTGKFEIDTTCTNASSHTVFVLATGGSVTPVFTKGVITVTECSCPYQGDFNADAVIDAMDLNAMINILFFNGQDIQDPACPAKRSDCHYNGASSARDLNWIIQHIFFNGPPPCDPCADPPCES